MKVQKFCFEARRNTLHTSVPNYKEVVNCVSQAEGRKEWHLRAFLHMLPKQHQVL